MDYYRENVVLARLVLALCRDYREMSKVPPPDGFEARALATALAVTIRRSVAPSLVLGLVVRDLSDAVMFAPRRMPPPRRRPRSRKNVIDLMARRRAGPEPA